VAVLDLCLAAFILFFLAMGLRRPFIWTLAYLYVDILAPQKISYSLLTNVQLSLVVFVLAVVGWAFFDKKEGARFSMRQFLMLICSSIAVSPRKTPISHLCRRQVELGVEGAGSPSSCP
jgi:hypothetical protein